MLLSSFVNRRLKRWKTFLKDLDSVRLARMHALQTVGFVRAGCGVQAAFSSVVR
jgi:hypothetical protein